MSVFLSVDPLHHSSPQEPFEVFLLTTLQFQAPRANFDLRLVDGKAVALLNGDSLFLLDFSFFEGFSLRKFDEFQAQFQTGLREHIFARKLTSRGGLVDVLGACPVDRKTFLIFNSGSDPGNGDSLEIHKVDVTASGQPEQAEEEKAPPRPQTALLAGWSDECAKLKADISLAQSTPFPSSLLTPALEIGNCNFEGLDEQAAMQALDALSKRLRVTEAELSSRVSRTARLGERLLGLERRMEARIEQLEQQRERIAAQFAQINANNAELAKKSTSVFKTLQLLSQKFKRSFENQALLGAISKSSSAIRLKMKENQDFLDSLEKDLFQVG